MATQRTNFHHTAGSADATALRPGARSAHSHHDDLPKAEIEIQLQRIFASPSFRSSKRSREFLRFVAEKALAGDTSEIKERLIGIEVFERPADYDLSADPIVRGAAVELRKRLAQYYAEPDHARELRVELPLGTYVPAFYLPSGAHPELEDVAAALHLREVAVAAATDLDRTRSGQPKPARSWTTRALVAGCALALAMVAVVTAAHYLRTQSASRSLDAFWAPVMNGGDAITVCVGDLNYLFADPPFKNVLQLHPNADNLLNPNAGAALLRVGSILGSRGKRSTLRFADLTELNDLRQQPIILIGGLNNQWTQRLLAGLRFQMANKPGGIGGLHSLIVDTKTPGMAGWSIDINAPLNSFTRDYSLITRMNDPLTGEPVVILCGLGPYGTSAASEFVSDPDYFSQFARQAPKGWQDHNFQIVLETQVVDGRVSVPRVVADQIY